MSRLKMDYDYRDLHDGEEKYQGYNIKENNVVDAEYTRAANPQHRGNMLIEALPDTKNTDRSDQIFRRYFKSLPPNVLSRTAPIADRKIMVSALRDLRIPMEYHRQVEFEFDRALRESYASRWPMVDDQQRKSTTVAEDASASVTGFALLGRAGTGKTSAISLLLEQYPQVIRHHTDIGTISQIVYLCVNCLPNSNMNGLLANIGAAVDKAVGCVDGEYENMILNARSTDKKIAQVRRLIERFSIDIIILDEIQHLSGGRNKLNSFESLLTLNNMTKVVFGVVGTEDAYEHIFCTERMARRVGVRIVANDYMEDRKTFDKVMGLIFQNQWFDQPIPLTDGLKKALFYYSDGVIDRMVTLCMYLNIEYLNKRERNENVIVDEAFLTKIVDKRFRNLRELLSHRKSKQNSLDKEQEFQIGRNALDTMMRENTLRNKKNLDAFFDNCTEKTQYKQKINRPSDEEMDMRLMRSIQ